MRSHLFILTFVAWAFRYISKKITAQTNIKNCFFQCFLLVVFQFHNMYLKDFTPLLVDFYNKYEKHSDSMCISGFPSTIYWRDSPFSIVYSWQLCWRSINCKCVGLFLGSLFWANGLYVCFYANDTFSLLLACVVYPKIWDYDASSFALIVQDWFGGSFVVPYEL